VRGKEGLRGSAFSQAQLYSMPAALCNEIAQAATKAVSESPDQPGALAEL
jgi:hypothetical protein